MVWADTSTSVAEWGSEEIVVPYISPVDGKRHRYFPDFYIKVKGKKYMVQVKPLYQSIEPNTQKRIDNKYIREVVTYSVNRAKWKAAQKFCKANGWQFQIITEKELKV